MKINKKIQKINQQLEQFSLKEQYYTKKKQLQKLKKETSKFNISTSKILMYFLFLNCTAIEIFTGIVTIINLNIAREIGINPDLTPLVTLIGTGVTQTIGFAIYSIKAAKQNCRGGIVYQQAMFQANNNLIYNQEDNINGIDC